MAGYPPVPPPPQYDPGAQREYARAQARAQKAAYRAQRDAVRWQMRSMRRASVVGPLLLIAIGVTFFLLQTGRLNYQNFWGWYGHWWPLLLVLAGLIVLAEWMLDQFLLRNPEHPRFRRSLGAGVFILLLFMVGAGIFASYGVRPLHSIFVFNGFNPDSLDQIFGDKHESDQNIDLTLSPGASFSVVNPRGDVTVNGTSDDGNVHIAVHKQVYASSDSDADQKAQEFSPATSGDASGLTLTMPSTDSAQADLVITMPASAATTIRTDHGDIHVSAIKAAVTVTANHGDIEMSEISGQATAHINNSHSSLTARNMGGGVTVQGHAGDVTLQDVTGPVSISGEIFGTTHLQHINGAVRYHTGRAEVQVARLDGDVEMQHDSSVSVEQALGPAVVSTHNGNVTLDRVAGDIAVTNRNGSIEVTAAPTIGNITLEDKNGSIRLTLPEKASYSVQAGTSNGDIESDLPISPWQSGNGKSMSGTVGSGGPTVRISTTNGDIAIHKADIAEIPATLPAPPKITLVPAAPPNPPKHAMPHRAE